MDELLRAGFAALGLPLDAAALARFQTYYTLLDERSKVMNLTAIHGETDVAQLHFLDSAALLTVEPLAGKTFRSRCLTAWISACAFSTTSAPPPASRT